MIVRWSMLYRVVSVAVVVVLLVESWPSYCRANIASERELVKHLDHYKDIKILVIIIIAYYSLPMM